MKILITGATGTLGQCVIKKLCGVHEITGISRDEQKIQSSFKHENVKYKICDIRNLESLKRLGSFDLIFHFAALKCVDILEANPHESYYTNILGTQNVLTFAGETKVVFTSTDKAVRAINVYGNCKAVAEALVLNHNSKNAVCRYGNVIGSRGSVVPIFKNTLTEQKKVYVTNLEMTRFWLTIDNAADFVISCAFKEGLQIPTMKSSSVVDLAAALSEILKVDDYIVEEIGIRPGEKIHEDMLPYELSSNNSIKYDKDELKILLESVL